MRQKVVVVVPEGGSLFEISTPIGIWGPDRGPIRDFDVDFVACGVENSDVTVSAGLALSGLGLLDDHLDDADLIIVPTWPILARPVPPSLSDRLERAHEQGSRIVGLCLGAFAVASTGLLDGLGAVTHWRYRDRFESMFPLVRFDPNTLYVDHESIVTSAGSAAAIDCCLHLVRRDHGAETAATIARSMVTAPHRSGAQSQFASAPPIPQGGDSLSRALAAAAENIGDIAGVDDLTALAATSRRSLER
ncbi:MAG: AraC family transcriptional regulator, partial [Actinomycetia bacterium]|nr:AraC family transcriptional regulator [Actinomycetes bacterium]